MKSALRLIALSTIGFAPMTALAEVLQLSPADPQPSSGALAQGLAVSYAKLPKNARELAVAKRALAKNGEPGTPIAGLTYDDTTEGAKVLTSDRYELLGAGISGYVKFDKAGTYVLDFLTNDGLEIFIGGQQVGLYDGIHACGYSGEVQVNVPKAGYYPLEATYFQRKGTACLMMEWGSDPDTLEFVTQEAFFHAK